MTEQKIKTDCEAADLNNQLKDTTNGEVLQARRGIPPYKLKIMLRYAEKIYSQLMDIPQFVPTYDDVEFILEVVSDTVRKARGENDVLV